MSSAGVSDIVAAEVRRLSQGAPVAVVVADGVATLTGEVPDVERRRLIEQGLLQLREVEDVHNFLRVAPPPGDVVAQLRGVLAREGVQIPDLQIDARDGELTLRGHAQGWFDRDAAERLAWTLPGVRQVANRIELPAGAVEPEPPTGDGRIV
jgi:osmotically-inducible protein OsmY